jgi:hypothetical protein
LRLTSQRISKPLPEEDRRPSADPEHLLACTPTEGPVAPTPALQGKEIFNFLFVICLEAIHLRELYGLDIEVKFELCS